MPAFTSPNLTAAPVSPTLLPGTGGPCTVLTVDDDPITTGLITSLLRKNNIAAQSCASGEEMWDMLEHASPSIILLDVEMPGDDGFSLAEQLRARYGLSVVIIMLTSHSRGMDIAMGLDCGADDYLTKPCNWPLVLQTLQKYLD